MDENPTTSLEKNTVISTNAKGSLNYYTIADIGSYFQLSISENSPNIQNPDFGVKVDLITRSICCLTNEGQKNLKIISLVDKYLEHARIYWFLNGGDEKMYMGSADMMVRNLENRFEILCPIKDLTILNTLKDYLNMQLHGNTKARIIDEFQQNEYNTNKGPQIRAQTDWRVYLKEMQSTVASKKLKK